MENISLPNLFKDGCVGLFAIFQKCSGVPRSLCTVREESVVNASRFHEHELFVFLPAAFKRF